MKKAIFTYMIFFLCTAYSFIYANSSVVQCLNDVGNNISSTGANGNTVSFPSDAGSFSGYYVNKDPSVTDIVGNYLSGYYYDSAYGFFQLNWDNTGSNNVTIVSQFEDPTKCTSGIGYKFSGYAKGIGNSDGTTNVNYINFAYDDNTYVYYCLNDKLLHGFAYSNDLGFQNFGGISFEAITQGTVTTLLLKKDDPFFVNNFTDILNGSYGSSSGNLNNTIQGDIITNETGKETIFYITK